jgi:single-strand DNA-binding protein
MLNNIAIMGRFTQNPELKTTNFGKNYLRFSIAVQRNFSKNNEVDFIDVLAWEKQADFISKYFKKGDMIAIVGTLQTNIYENRSGQKVKQVYILANQMNFCGGKKSESAEILADEDIIEFDDVADLPF